MAEYEKKMVFISHINEEKALAIALKTLIEDAFLKIIDVFVSSDETSIGLGEDWFNTLIDRLKRCNIMVVLCSPTSVGRPWINFETGAGWVRDGVLIIPLCHSGMTLRTLPMPFNVKQTVLSANDENSIRRLLPLIATKLGSATPTADLSSFVAEVKRFEDEYTFWGRLNPILQHLNEMPKLLDHLNDIDPATKAGVVVPIPPHLLSVFMEDMNWLASHNIVTIEDVGEWSMDARGPAARLRIVPLPKWRLVFADPKCAKGVL